MTQTATTSIQLRPFEAWLQPRIPHWLLTMWLLGLRGTSPVPLGQRLKGVGWFGLLFGLLTLISVWILWLAARLALVLAAAIITAGLLARDHRRSRTAA